MSQCQVLLLFLWGVLDSLLNPLLYAGEVPLAGSVIALMLQRSAGYRLDDLDIYVDGRLAVQYAG